MTRVYLLSKQLSDRRIILEITNILCHTEFIPTHQDQYSLVERLFCNFHEAGISVQSAWITNAWRLTPMYTFDLLSQSTKLHLTYKYFYTLSNSTANNSYIYKQHIKQTMQLQQHMEHTTHFLNSAFNRTYSF